MAQQISMVRLLGSKDFYNGGLGASKEGVASHIGLKTIEDFCCFFLSYYSRAKVPDVMTMMREWFTTEGFDYTRSFSYLYLSASITPLLSRYREHGVALLSAESLLNMYSWVQTANIPKESGKVDSSMMTRYFNLLLLFNDDVLENYDVARRSIEKYGEDKVVQRLMLAMMFPQHDLVNPDYALLTYTQFYKTIVFLNFLEASKTFARLYSRLLEDFNCADKGEYLKAIGGLAILCMRGDKPGWIELKVDDTTGGREILDRLVISHGEALNVEDDYLHLRSKPFKEMGNGYFRLIFDLFVVKKLYNGLVFKLREYVHENREIISTDYFGTLRMEFSEAELCYEVLSAVCKQSSTVDYTGDQLKDMGVTVEPDYYSRQGNNILIFESKDFYMQGGIKLSYDFDAIYTELRKDGRLGKAVKQLAKNAVRSLGHELPDKDYSIHDVTIYPVIIVHDALYSAPSLNYWVNEWFNDELEMYKAKKEFRHINFANINPVTVIEIDTLIFYKQQFENSNFALVQLINEYHSHVQLNNSDGHPYRLNMPFSEITRDKGFQLGIIPDLNSLYRLFAEFGIV